MRNLAFSHCFNTAFCSLTGFGRTDITLNSIAFNNLEHAKHIYDALCNFLCPSLFNNPEFNQYACCY